MGLYIIAIYLFLICLKLNPILIDGRSIYEENEEESIAEGSQRADEDAEHLYDSVAYDGNEYLTLVTDDKTNAVAAENPDYIDNTAIENKADGQQTSGTMTDSNKPENEVEDGKDRDKNTQKLVQSEDPVQPVSTGTIIENKKASPDKEAVLRQHDDDEEQSNEYEGSSLENSKVGATEVARISEDYDIPEDLNLTGGDKNMSDRNDDKTYVDTAKNPDDLKEDEQQHSEYPIEKNKEDTVPENIKATKSPNNFGSILPISKEKKRSRDDDSFEVALLDQNVEEKLKDSNKKDQEDKVKEGDDDNNYSDPRNHEEIRFDDQLPRGSLNEAQMNKEIDLYLAEQSNVVKKDSANDRELTSKREEGENNSNTSKRKEQRNNSLEGFIRDLDRGPTLYLIPKDCKSNFLLYVAEKSQLPTKPTFPS